MEKKVGIYCRVSTNEKYTGAVTFLDSATQAYQYKMNEFHSSIITESEFRVVKEERTKRSNVVTDDDGTHRSRKNIVQRKKNI